MPRCVVFRIVPCSYRGRRPAQALPGAPGRFVARVAPRAAVESTAAPLAGLGLMRAACGVTPAIVARNCRSPSSCARDRPFTVASPPSRSWSPKTTLIPRLSAPWWSGAPCPGVLSSDAISRKPLEYVHTLRLDGKGTPGENRAARRCHRQRGGIQGCQLFLPAIPPQVGRTPSADRLRFGSVRKALASAPEHPEST